MSANKNDGGPAFPSKTYDANGTHSGMTLRDYFAAKAMQAILPNFIDTHYAHDIANRAYQIADAMIKERDL